MHARTHARIFTHKHTHTLTNITHTHTYTHRHTDTQTLHTRTLVHTLITLFTESGHKTVLSFECLCCHRPLELD